MLSPNIKYAEMKYWILRFPTSKLLAFVFVWQAIFSLSSVDLKQMSALHQSGVWALMSACGQVSSIHFKCASQVLKRLLVSLVCRKDEAHNVISVLQVLVCSSIPNPGLQVNWWQWRGWLWSPCCGHRTFCMQKRRTNGILFSHGFEGWKARCWYWREEPCQASVGLHIQRMGTHPMLSYRCLYQCFLQDSALMEASERECLSPVCMVLVAISEK